MGRCALLALVFISMGTSGRHLRPMGFEDQPKVANSNLLLSCTALFACGGVPRCVLGSGTAWKQRSAENPVF